MVCRVCQCALDAAENDVVRGTGSVEGVELPVHHACLVVRCLPGSGKGEGMKGGSEDAVLTLRCDKHKEVAWDLARELGALRRIGCVLCAKYEKEAEDWDRWALPARSSFHPYQPTVFTQRAEIPDLPTSVMFQQGVPTEDIAQHFVGSAITPIQSLSNDIRCGAAEARREPASMLETLRGLGYGGYDVATLGGKLKFFVHDPRDRALLLDPTYMPAPVLASRGMGAAFVNLLRAGITLDEIAAAGYTVANLKELGFSVRAFVAAGGTPAHLERMKLSLDILAREFEVTHGLSNALQGKEIPREDEEAES